VGLYISGGLEPKAKEARFSAGLYDNSPNKKK